jgi:hypothetical protein
MSPIPESCDPKRVVCTKLDIYIVISNIILDHPVYFQSNQPGITREISLQYQILKTQHVNLRELYFNLHCSKLKIIYDQDEGNLGYDFHSRKSRKT